MKKTILFSILIMLLLLTGFYFNKNKNKVSDSNKYITYVAGEGILRSDYEKELAKTKQFLVWSKQDSGTLSSLEQTVLERMIEMKIISSYAQKNNITVDQKEIEAQYTARLKNKSETEYLATIKEMYGMEKSDFMQKLYEDLLKEKVQQHLQKPLVTWLEEMKSSGAYSK